MAQSIHNASMKGLRDQNEDAHTIFVNMNGRRLDKGRVNMYAVYDGHGGKAVSEFLSRNAPGYFTGRLSTHPVSRAYIKGAFGNLQKRLVEKHGNVSRSTGSTALVVLHYDVQKDSPNHGPHITVMNTGDSRCVICRDNLAYPLTKDHKPEWPEERRRIERLGGDIYRDGPSYRVGNLSVSRAFGDTDTAPYVTHVPDIFRYKLGKMDRFIILACDGLWDCVTSQEAVNFVISKCYDNTLLNRTNDGDNIARALARYALMKQSTDNVTVIVVFLSPQC